jgi:Polyketide cyclase / dehydrase and lipid transport
MVSNFNNQKYEELNHRRQISQSEGEFMLKIWFFSLLSFSLASFACAEKLNHKEIPMTFTAKHISVSINRSAAQVYEFASNPENLPKWAGGLSGSIKQINEDWIAESPMGKVKVKFAEKNKFGVLDHEVTLPSGVKFYNPMRVFPNNDGSELVFTLYRRPNVSDQEFAEDAKSVEKDLANLKSLLEK